MSEISMLTASVAGADFHVMVGYQKWVFGLVAYRQHTQVLLGDETAWFAVPSWLALVLFVGLAAAEWLLLRLLRKGWRIWWNSRRPGATPRK